ncbi:hypothetical protein C8J56DRAFT_325441 [Mycena floridula]|nr:hypothetical protein C8J56DRAFT_325441 [Mycena floridula]
MNCDHKKLNFGMSSFAEEAGYKRPTSLQLSAATTPQGRVAGPGSKGNLAVSPTSFPAPLVLPDDDLALDPRYPPQSFRSFLRLKERNEVTPSRNRIYVASPPRIDSEVQFMQTWSTFNDSTNPSDSVPVPSTDEVISYMSAFYGLSVQPLSSPILSFTPWEENRSKAPRYVGLKTSSTECVRIRTRPSLDGTFSRQLNLDDLLDAAIDVLPDDAFSLLLLVEQDIYENDDDDFACGRAYGASRIAVVSMARYHPGLDRKQNVVREHAWPASHCDAYMKQCIPRPAKKAKKSKDEDAPLEAEDSALKAAVAAHNALPQPESPLALSGLWLGRICKTAGHELGHCFGMDHCVYYACSMQGTASLVEDARQPPYLCPVDLAKLIKATGGSVEKHYDALLKFCESERQKEIQLFAAHAAWIRVRLVNET